MFTFVLYKDRKKALAMAIVLGVLLALLVPAVITAPPRYVPVDGYVRDYRVNDDPDDPDWVEFAYEYGSLVYFVRFDESVGSLQGGDIVTLYANSKQPELVAKEKPYSSDVRTLLWFALAPIGLMFAGAVVSCVFAFRKEKQHADT